MTPYISIDIETTGLDDSLDQILEIGAVYETWDRPVEELKSFQILVRHDRTTGNPFALAMNADILRELANGRGADPVTAINSLYTWLYSIGVVNDGMLVSGGLRDKELPKVTFAGKNFAKFDLQFLKRMPGWDKIGSKTSHRSIDPAILYWQEGDEELPSTRICMQRAGLDPDVKHRAVADARDVIRLVRFAKGVA